MIAAVLSPGFFVFLFSPLLDVRFSRRTYALVFSVLAAAAMAFSVAHRTNPTLIEGVMLAGYIAASLVQGAVGGWMGSLCRRKLTDGWARGLLSRSPARAG